MNGGMLHSVLPATPARATHGRNSGAKAHPPPPPRAPVSLAFSSYPDRFAVGQVGHSPETRMNRAFRVSNLHICSGTRLGHSGTLRYQDVSGRAKGHIDGRAPLSRVVWYQGFSGRSQARPSVPAGSLVGVGW